jgi:hypothetical protein
VREGTRLYPRFRSRLALSHLALSGVWSIDGEAATAGRGATLDLEFGARRVFCVLGSEGDAARRLQVLLDGRPVPARLAGADVRAGVATVRDHRLYRLIDLPAAGRHELGLRLSPGISGYAFTFG